MTFSSYGGGVHHTAYIGGNPESREWRPGDPAFAPEIDPSARIEAFVSVDAGLWAPTIIGAHTWLMKHSHVGHDVVVGADCELSPGVIVGGHAVIGNKVRVGIGAVIRPFVNIGDGARVGMGAVVVKDVPAGVVVYGNPAREHPGPEKSGDYGLEPDPRRVAGWSREFARSMARMSSAGYVW